MKSNCVKQADKRRDKSSGWAKALQEAQVQLFQVKLRQNTLQQAVKIIKAMIQAGEPWPEDSAT
jgi:hypothetical protein